MHLLLFECMFFWYLNYIHALKRNLIFATQVLTKLVRPLYLLLLLYNIQVVKQA